MIRTNKTAIAGDFKQIQRHICQALEKADRKGIFMSDDWNRKEGGGGTTKIIREGNIIKKGGVAFSEVYGPTPDKILKKLDLARSDFFATGVSIVIHPDNPWVPIIHMNIRYFEMSNGVYWFGGGIDLTPHYVDWEDGVYFHQAIKEVCDQYDSTYYPRFKKWADDYFFIQHRKETRGIGGIFFDRLTATSSMPFERLFDYVKSIGYLFPKIYQHLMHKNANKPYGEREKQWQALRRGRYVEFNLVWDAGTKFGLDTNGRTESILMSMPPSAQWEYSMEPDSGSKEAETQKYLIKGIDWINTIR
ncbi:MAG: oxygen-dependent coproporphyrinogen oxidase [Cyclobacteriaceae bacterium]